MCQSFAVGFFDGVPFPALPTPRCAQIPPTGISPEVIGAAARVWTLGFNTVFFIFLFHVPTLFQLASTPYDRMDLPPVTRAVLPALTLCFPVFRQG
jgi:hypothetical protein